MQITNVNQAVSILIQVAHAACAAGILTLPNAALTNEAVEFLMPSETQEQVQETVPVQNEPEQPIHKPKLKQKTVEF